MALRMHRCYLKLKSTIFSGIPAWQVSKKETNGIINAKLCNPLTHYFFQPGGNKSKPNQIPG